MSTFDSKIEAQKGAQPGLPKKKKKKELNLYPYVNESNSTKLLYDMTYIG